MIELVEITQVSTSSTTRGGHEGQAVAMSSESTIR